MGEKKRKWFIFTVAKWVCFNSAVFGVGVVPCVRQAERQIETEEREVTERQEGVTQEGKCETQRKWRRQSGKKGL